MTFSQVSPETDLGTSGQRWQGDARQSNGLGRWYFAFFVVSGACGLVYEAAWVRLAMANFGVTTPMISIVLSVFMAGLGLGSWSGGIFVCRLDRQSALDTLRSQN